MTTCTQIKTAQKSGEYVRTGLDAAKSAAEFVLTDLCVNRIVWAGGRVECVSDRTLAKLQKAHTWQCDF